MAKRIDLKLSQAIEVLEATTEGLTKMLQEFGTPPYIVRQSQEVTEDLKGLRTSLEDLEDGEPLVINDVLMDIIGPEAYMKRWDSKREG